MRYTALLVAVAVGGCAPTLVPLVVPDGVRAVIVAPHPDDETLAAGGLAQRILRSGGSVRVIVVTAGDGYREAAAAASGHAEPTASDYRALGALRARELAEAMRLLGIRDVVQLDGPDGGVDALEAAPRTTPYTAPETGRGPFSGEDLARRLGDAIAAMVPTLVVFPDPRDHHADHAATGRFVRDVVARLPVRPRLLSYLVHDVVWPPPHPTDDLLPPPATAEYANTTWTTFTLTPGELATKRAALAAYRSQWPIIGGLLERFVRRNEVFAMAP